MKKYLSFPKYDTMKVEVSNKENDFYIVFTIMWEEVQVRLDKEWFYRNLIKKIDQVTISKAVEDLKNLEFKLAEWEVRTTEQTAELWKIQEELEAKYTTRCDYVVEWVNRIELYEKLVALELQDEDIGYSRIDEAVE